LAPVEIDKSQNGKTIENAQVYNPHILLQTHGTSTWNTKTPSFKHALHRNLALGGHPSLRNTLLWEL